MKTDLTILSALMLSLAVVGCNSGKCCTDCCDAGTYAEADDPVALTAEESAAWDNLGKKLNAAWADADVRYRKTVVPVLEEVETYKISAWKGERASAQFLLWTAVPKECVSCEISDFVADGSVLPASVAETRFVRYSLSDKTTYKRFKKGGPATLSPDMLDTLFFYNMEARTVRPVWLTVNVPQDAPAGIYKSVITVSHDGFGKVRLPLELEVVNHVLPTPDKWDYHLDLWQHPTSVARAHGLEVWSDEHFEALKPVMKRLADAGQKVITATLNKDPWNHQCYDGYAPMINWTKHKNGSWSYDYSVFDRWVQLMLDLGIDREINCYSMVPWNCELEYFDEAEGKMVTVKAEPGTPIFPKIWEPFLKDFKKHLEAKGWLSITNIAMDERSPEAMRAAADVLTRCAPEMGFALADNHRSYKKFTMMRDVCVAIHHARVSQEDIDMRRANGFYTTFYVCCVPAYPNTFTTSDPFESEMLGWYNIACDYDGMLRWAYNSWAEDPQYDSRYGNWMSGDTYLVYPYNRSSMRFERLIDGIENAEKIRQLRREGVDVTLVDQALEKIRTTDAHDPKLPWKEIIAESRAALEEVSRK
ncbi:MAG: DUF4091 domain-containing protein [Bacteroidales bacterium]|nr:DUF4091 domain-containing protein [Bacteroidales bacterium]